MAKKGNDDEEEVTLGVFQGICHNCKKKGHKAVDCRFKKKSFAPKDKKINGDCNNCGKLGQKAVDCWFDKRNKDKRPGGWGARGGRNTKNTQEQVHAAVGSVGSVEYLLAGLEFPKSVKLFNDPAFGLLTMQRQSTRQQMKMAQC